MVKSLRIHVFLLLFNFSTTGCDKVRLFSDDDLSLAPQAYNGAELKVDGYYYKRSKRSNGMLFGSLFFYRNGVCLDVGGTREQLEDIDEYITNEILIDDSYMEIKVFWGAFQIKSDTIKFEFWYSNSGGPFPAYVREGVIINDTTFLIVERYRYQNGEKTEAIPKSELYHFRAFTPKPDSTNSYVN
jgi:hypothetical protein